MKSRLTYSFALLILTVVSLTISPELKQSDRNHSKSSELSNLGNEFITGAMHNACDQRNNYTSIADTFHMNTWHKYTAPSGWGWYKPGTDTVDQNDNWNSDTSLYGSNVRQSISNNNSAGLRTIMDRPIIQYLAFGQRSDYQCESLLVSQDGDLWFYTYKNSVNNGTTITDETDTSIYGNNQRVKHCSPSVSDAGYIVRNLRANHEQANRLWPYWINDNTYKWYIKPRIRIDSAFADTNPNDTVCRIEIINWHGEMVRQVGLLGKNFVDSNLNYDGRYLDNFYLDITNNIDSLSINPGSLLCPLPDSGKNFTTWDDQHPIRTDYRVYWYGTCEMWIDYIRVENQPSAELHSGSQTILSRINQEVQWALTGYDSSRPNNFYIEEFEFNTLSSIKRVNELIKYYSDNKLSLMVNLQYDLFRVHIPYVWQNNTLFSSDFIKRFLIDSAGIQYLVYNSYNLEGWEESERPSQISKHPYTLTDSDYKKSSGILSYVSYPDEYETWLQNRFDTGAGFTAYNYIMKLCDSLSKSQEGGLRLINLQQAHLWYAGGHKLKEPSSQEAEMMSGLAISYGAKGLLYFSYDGNGDISDDSYFYMRGLTNPGRDLRYTNVYGWPKAYRYSDMIQKYNTWGPYLMSFNDEQRHSYIYRIEEERNALINSSYFTDVVSYKPGSGQPDCNEDDPGETDPAGYVYECREDRYLQVAVFDDGLDNEYKYFMIINRRCSPFINTSTSDNNGGRRIIRIRFNPEHPEFSDNRYWNITNLESDSVITVFDKDNNILLDLGFFMPGEGKLYKITPLS